MRAKILPLKLFTLLLAISSVVTGYSQSCPSGLVSYWKLQESGTTFEDAYGSHDATVETSGPSQVEGISGYGQLFAGSYLLVPSHSAYNWTASSSFTLELWVKYTEFSGTQVILGRDDISNQTHWWIGKNSSGKIDWFTKASDGSNGIVEGLNALTNGAWHHIVAVRDGSTSKNYLYIDGVLQNTGGTVVTLSGNLTSSEGITMGAMKYNGTPDFYYNGSLDEVAIYSRAITSTEVTTHYNNAKDYMMGICSDVSPELLSNPVLTATLNQAYTYNVNASGNPAPKYYLDKKPTNMTIDENTGVISWTPTSFSQNAPVSVRITNSGGTIYQNYSIFLSNPPVCNNNLEAFWNFETTGSPQVDQIAAYTLNSNSASSLPARVGGRVGYGLLFDGVNDSLDMEDSFEASSQNVFFDFDDVPNFSIELWMKSAATAGNVMVLLGRDETDNNTQYWLGVNSSGNLALYFRDYIGNALYYDSESNLLDNQWHHIVVTYNATSNNMEIYVDKALIETLNQNFGNFGGFNDLNIGCLFDHSGADRFWYKGIIDELAFYNTNISETLVAADYDKGILSKGICSQNYAPLIVSTATITATEDAAYSYKLIATDGSENDISDITAVVKPAWLTLVYNASDTTATLSGTPTNDNVGANNITLRVTDGSINVDQTFTITVANVNDAPTITSTPAASVNEDALYSYVVVGSDVDAGDVLTYTAPTKPAWLTFDAGTRTLSGTPTNDNVGVADITITVSDGTASVNQSYSLTVNNVNDAPEFTSDPVLTVHANQLYMYTVTASDVDEGDVITYTVQSKPSWLSFVAGSTSAILSGTPTVNDQGTHAIILRVSDGHVETMQGYTLTVTAPSALEDIDNSIVNQVFPNPASDKVYFRFAKAGNIRIEIYDMSGNLRKQIQGENGDAIEVNISDLSHGLFIYKAYQDDKVGIGKITKE